MPSQGRKAGIQYSLCSSCILVLALFCVHKKKGYSSKFPFRIRVFKRFFFFFTFVCLFVLGKGHLQVRDLLLESGPVLYHGSSRVQNQVVRVISEHLYLLSHLTV